MNNPGIILKNKVEYLSEYATILLHIFTKLDAYSVLRPASDLLKETNKLSVHQETFYQIGVNAVKIHRLKRPTSISNLINQKEGKNTRKKAFEKKIY